MRRLNLFEILLVLLCANTSLDAAEYYLGVYTSYIRLILYALVLYMSLKLLDFKMFIPSSFYLYMSMSVYFLILIMMSSNIFYSFTQYLAVVLSMFVYYIAFNIQSITNIKSLKYAALFISLVFIFNGVFSTIFGIGESPYGDVFFLSGSLTHNKIYPASLVLLLLPLLSVYFKKNEKLYYYILFFILLIVIIFTMRRTGILLLLFGGGIYFIYYPNKMKSLKVIVITLTIILATFPIYSDVLLSQLELRGDRVSIERTLDRGVEGETRGREILSVTYNIFSFDEPRYSFFGTELFNSRGTYNSAQFNFNPNRLLHSDYSTILHGSGLIGLSLYVIFLFMIYFDFKRNVAVNNYWEKILYSTYIVMFSSMILISIPGRLTSMSFRTIIFFILGFIAGYFYRKKRNYV